MPVSDRIKESAEKGLFIRKMFEDGPAHKSQYGLK